MSIPAIRPDERVPGVPMQVPTVFISYRIGDCPYAGLKVNPWHVTDCEAVLVNAFDMVANRRTRNEAKAIEASGTGIHGHLNFDGPIWLDSGAFNFLSHPEISISPEQVWEVGTRLKPDAIVALDHPFPPGTMPDEVSRRVSISLENASKMARLRSPGSPSLVPVLHGHDPSTLEACRVGYEDDFGKQPLVFGLGSLAMLAKYGSVRSLFSVIRETRSILPNGHLHVFSVGSPLLMHFAFLAGASSVDTQAWILSAAFKQVFIPGEPQMRLAQRMIDQKPVEFEKRLELSCQAILSAQDTGLKLRNWESGEPIWLRDEADAADYFNDLLDRPGRPRIHHRACHNAQVMVSESRQYRESADRISFVALRMRRTPYRKALDELVEEMQRTR